MNKNEIIKYLTSNNVEFNAKASYKELLKIYYRVNTKDVTVVTSSEVVTEPIINEDVTVVTSSEVVTELSIKEKLIIDIVKFMESIKGRTKGTPQEIKIMFDLYNNYYKRSETPVCSICVGNVHAKMLAIYKKFKK